MDREFIVNGIKRLAHGNGGNPPGREIFRQATEIRHHQWLGVYWSTWGAALSEAGFKPNSMAVAFDKDFLLEKLASVVRDIQKFPTDAELALYSRGKAGIPPGKAFQRHFKTKAQTVRALRAYCERNGGLSDVLEICSPLLTAETESAIKVEKIKPTVKGRLRNIAGSYRPPAPQTKNPFLPPLDQAAQTQ